MSAKSTSRTRNEPERLTNLLFVLIFVGLFIGTGLYYYHPTPPLDYADGVYESPGRPDVIIHEGTVEIGGDRAQMKLGYEKNALVGSLDAPLGPLFHPQGGRRTPVDLFFDGNGRFSTTDHDWKEVVYQRSQGAPRK